jgi:hypothetical protein
MGYEEKALPLVCTPTNTNMEMANTNMEMMTI